MVDPKNYAPVMFIIDTNSYAGNFERNMVAYISGEIGECGVGDEEAAIFLDEETIFFDEDEFCHMPDDHGTMRPATIVLSDSDSKNLYNSVALGLFEKPSSDVIELFKKRARAFCEYWEKRREWHDKIDITGFRLMMTEIRVDTSIDFI